MKLRILAICSVCLAVMAISLRAHEQRHDIEQITVEHRDVGQILTPVDKRRAEEQTFITYPEWFLVYSPQEYADLIKDRPASEFPFLQHIGQFWQGYASVYRATKDEYEFNGEYHLMVMIIGVSTTIEYGMKWAYEETIGRLSEVSCANHPTREDELAAQIAREYVEFLDVEPWYKFDYVSAIRRVWTETGFWGKHPLRKWERKYALTTEFAIKAAYAKLLRMGSESAYGEIATVTPTVLERLPNESNDDLSEMKIVEQFSDGSVLVELPRYQKFTTYASKLAKQGIDFIEIAGNRAKITVSARVPDDFDVHEPIILTQPILTQPGTNRIVFTVTVDNLASTIRMLDERGAKLEHIYDY